MQTMKPERTNERRVIKCPKCGLVQFWPYGKQKCVKPGCNHAVTWNMTARMELHPEAPIGTKAPPGDTHKIDCRVKEIRLARGMSQKELGKRMGCRRTYISKIERKKGTPLLEQVYRLAAGLGVKAAHLLDPWLPAGDLAHMTSDDIEERERFIDEVSVLLPEVSLNDRQIVLGMAAELAQGIQPLREWITI